MPSNLMMRSVSREARHLTGAVVAQVIAKLQVPLLDVRWINVAPCGAKRRGKVTSHATFEYPTWLQLSEGYDWMATVSKQRQGSC